MNRPRIAAVILAAGAASRFGSPKQLADFRGEPMLMRTVRRAREAGATHVIVVLGAHADVVASILGESDDVAVVVNREWATGLASSIRAGLAAVQIDSIDAVLLLTVDQPLIDARDLTALIDAFACGDGIAAAEYNGMAGVPALISTRHISELARAVSGDRGAALWLRGQGDRVARVRMDTAASDIDTIEELCAIEQS